VLIGSLVTGTAMAALCGFVVLGVAVAVSATRPEHERRIVGEGTVAFLGALVSAAASLHVLLVYGYGVGVFIGLIAVLLAGMAIHSFVQFRAMRRQQIERE
jgi:hypothetical protein